MHIWEYKAHRVALNITRYWSCYSTSARAFSGIRYSFSPVILQPSVFPDSQVDPVAECKRFDIADFFGFETVLNDEAVWKDKMMYLLRTMNRERLGHAFGKVPPLRGVQ